jgi:hypothetical protein
MLRLQQQDMLLRSKLDRVYEDRLSDAISDELWTAKSAELHDEPRRVRTEMERHEGANPRDQARLVKTVVSNSTFDRGSLSPTYVKPFDVFANGGKTGDWLAALDDFRNWLIREAA